MNLETALNDGPDRPGSSALNSATVGAAGTAESRQVGEGQMQQVAWIVTADGLRMAGPFDDRDDAEGFAAAWNHAYPPPEHTDFVVEQITAEEAKHLDRRNA